MIYKTSVYTHEQNEVELTVSLQPYYSERGQYAGTKYIHRLKGKLQAASQAAITTAIAALELAYRNGGYDAGLYLDDGTTLTGHYLTNSTAVGGVRCVSIDYPIGNGAQYSTFRDYEITLEADYQTGTNALRDFSETISFEGGGGPRKVFIETLDGYVIEQITAQRTAYRAIQQGSSMVYGDYPRAPPPIWPNAEIVDQRRVSPIGPQIEGRNRTVYGMQWQYVFQSATPLSGFPTVK